MKSSRVRLETIAEPENLREAFLLAAKGKADRTEVIAFRKRLDTELFSLRQEILGERPAVGGFSSFTIHEPKERRIHAPHFRERVLHHALLRPVEADFERWLIDDTFACRRGKGREAALRRAETFAGRHAWFLKLDIARYFDSIPHHRLLAEIRRRFRDRRVAALWRRIVKAYATAPGRGLPIGALTSQHLANFYLGGLDRYIKEQLRLRGYVRYMDDMVCFGEREELRAATGEIRRVAEESLGLRLNPAMTLQPCARGLPFLGYRVFSGGSCLKRASRRRFLRRWSECESALETGRLSEEEYQRRVLALSGFVRVANRERLLDFLFGSSLDDGHRARTGSTAAAPGTTPPATRARPTATGTPLATATTTSASASPSAHANASGGTHGLNRPSSRSASATTGSGRMKTAALPVLVGKRGRFPNAPGELRLRETAFLFTPFA